MRDDFVIVLRVLSKEEIQAYAAATQVLRGTSGVGVMASARRADHGVAERRRNRSDADRDHDDEGGRRHHRSHRYKDDEEQDEEDWDREREAQAAPAR